MTFFFFESLLEAARTDYLSNVSARVELILATADRCFGVWTLSETRVWSGPVQSDPVGPV